MHPLPRVFLSSLTALSLVTASVASQAQEAPPAQAGPAPRPSARASNGEYVAPIYQQTQGTYVPQSVALSGPRQIVDWEEGEPVPEGYHVSSRVRKGPIIGGAISFGVLYFFSALVAAGGADANPNGSNPVWSLYVPAVGPFMQMGHTSSQTANVFLVADGLGQSVGLALLLYGLTSPKTVLVRNDLAKPMLTPLHIGKDGYGLGLTGAF